MLNKINMAKLGFFVLILVNVEVLHIVYVIQNIIYLKKITINFYNGSDCGYHFIIKNLADECERQYNCLGEYTEK